jgi:hypothetical protein
VSRASGARPGTQRKTRASATRFGAILRQLAVGPWVPALASLVRDTRAPTAPKKSCVPDCGRYSSARGARKIRRA